MTVTYGYHYTLMENIGSMQTKLEKNLIKMTKIYLLKF